MGAIEGIGGELLEADQFFAPSSTDMVDGLVGQYRQARARIEKVAEIMAGELGGVVPYFIEGNKRERDNWYRLDTLFSREGAVAALNADYWNRALKLTDVLDCMPQKRRDEWYTQIREMKTPDFEEETVRSTLADMLAMRSKFFAERVDGLFRALSGEHVTNRPEGFGKRMIIGHVISSFGTVEYSRCGYINDLRAVIAKFMGREELKYNATDDVIKAARRHNGEWMNVDGGALRIRVYNGVGTAHLEVHPDMAWRLNCVLASLYPLAIPPKFRSRPKRTKEHALINRPLPFSVVCTIAAMQELKRRVQHTIRDHFVTVPNTRTFRNWDVDPAIQAEVGKVLEAVGAVELREGRMVYWQFDYQPDDVIDEIVCSGCIPDHKSHQFYPTPATVAEIAIEMARIEPGHNCLEPSAGHGGLADLMPKTTTCVEVSSLHCQILRAKGYESVIEGDFIDWSWHTTCAGTRFDRVVMNPPFSDGRWQAHLSAAAQLVKPGGRLVAILPASARGKDLLPGWACEWSGTIVNEFAGTSVAVVILAATRAAA